MSNESMPIDYANDKELIKAWNEIVTSIQHIENEPYRYIFAIEKFANAFSSLHEEHKQDAGSEDFGNAIIALSNSKKLIVTQEQGEKAVSIYSSFALYYDNLFKTENRSLIEDKHFQELSKSDSSLTQRHGLIRTILGLIPAEAQLPDKTKFNADIETTEDYTIPKFYHAYYAYYAYPDFINALKTIEEFPTKEISPAIATEIKKMAARTRQLAKTAKHEEIHELVLRLQPPWSPSVLYLQ